MDSNLDMALDEIIRMNRQQQQTRRGRGRGGRGSRVGRARMGTAAVFFGRGGRTSGALRVRRPLNRSNRPAAYQLARTFFGRNSNGPWRSELLEDVMDGARSMGIETGTKLYLSNLDYGVSNEDIKELFSEIGDLKRCGIHYDRSGRSKGTAEVVYSRRQDAVVALKRYNNVMLDGKLMKIELIGTNLSPPISQTRNGVPAFGRGRRMVFMRGGRGRAWRFRGRGGRGRRAALINRDKKTPTVEELDADLEKYHQAAMQTS